MSYFVPIFNNYTTIISPRARVGCEMKDNRVGYNHFISNKREWNNYFIKSNIELLLDLADFTRTTKRQFNGRYF